MAVNIHLEDLYDPEPGDPLERRWVGWDSFATDSQLWAANRGLWESAGETPTERFATLSHDGVIQVVAEIVGREWHPTPGGLRWAFTGDVLLPGDPVRDQLVGTPVPTGGGSLGYLDTSWLDRLSTAERSQSVHRDPVTMLATWNPKLWARDAGQVAAEIRATAGGAIVRGRWSTGSRRSGIEPGDRVFLLLQGVGPRGGIVGSGTCASRIFSDTHWDPQRPDHEAQFVLIQWDTLLPADDSLLRVDLVSQIPAGEPWRPQSSGTVLPVHVAAELELAWARHLGQTVPVPPRTSPRQRWQMDPARRKKVEDAAQTRLTQHFEAQGWTVKDTRHGNPYDAVASKDGEILYLEAKGTETSGAAVIVTPNEVRWARAHPAQCVLGVLSDIRFLTDGEVDPASGTFRVVRWDPDTGTLQPRDYDWTPPSEG